MSEPFLFDVVAIRMALERLDAELVRRNVSDVALIVVGGAAMTLDGYRARSTTDIDTVTLLEGELLEAIAEIAADGLPLEWLNDHARPWKPNGMGLGDCHRVFEGRALEVMCPHPRWLVLMKINRSLSVDLQDLRALWPHAGFADAREAANEFYDAYPLEDPDPYLPDHIQQQIIDKLADGESAPRS